jgi:hypothetical protein
MSNIATSGRAFSVLPGTAGGDGGRFRRLRFFLAVLRARPSFALGYAIVTTVVAIALLAPWLVPYGPMNADPSVYLLPPGGSHVLGTDGTGMDIFSRVLFAPRVDLAIAIVGTFLSATIGGAVGAIVGYYEGQHSWRRALSTFVMRSADVLEGFPGLCVRNRPRCGLRAERKEHHSRDRIREHANLPEADADPGSIDQPAPVRRGCLCGRRF